MGLDFFSNFQDKPIEGFWNYCEAENEETEIPDIEGEVKVVVTQQQT